MRRRVGGAARRLAAWLLAAALVPAVALGQGGAPEGPVPMPVARPAAANEEAAVDEEALPSADLPAVPTPLPDALRPVSRPAESAGLTPTPAADAESAFDGQADVANTSFAASDSLAPDPGDEPLTTATADDEPASSSDDLTKPATRPEARPAGAVLLGGTLLVAPPAPPVLATPAALAPATLAATEDDAPAAARAAPPLAPDTTPALTGGAPAELRAELAMTEIVPFRIPVTMGAPGVAPPTRPGAERTAGEAPRVGRPRARPATPVDPVPLAPPEPDAPAIYRPGVVVALGGIGPSDWAPRRAMHPLTRPEGLAARAAERAAETPPPVTAVRGAGGAICGNPLLQGEVIAPIPGPGACGVDEPVRVQAVAGIRLSEGATITCDTANALASWVEDAVRPTFGARGGGVVQIDLMGHYSCRPRNNRAGARLSEHSYGRAVDVGGFRFADGTRLTVVRDGRSEIMQEVHRAACRPFSTTLGPGSDGYHEDHFHYDVAPRGDYCR